MTRHWMTDDEAAARKLAGADRYYEKAMAAARSLNVKQMIKVMREAGCRCHESYSAIMADAR